MPRTIPAPLLAHLQGKVLTTALLFTISRTDGVTLGLTTANVPLTYAPTGQTYDPLDSAAASQLRQTATTGVDNVTVAGVLRSTEITDGDLLAGRYDGAGISIDLVNYQEHPLVSKTNMVTGTLGEVTFADGQYQAEFRSLSARLQQKMGNLTSATCRVRQLFDTTNCFVGGSSYYGDFIPANFRYNSVPVVSVPSQQTINFTAPGGTGTGSFDYGSCQFTTGANAGIFLEIKNSFLQGAAMQITFVSPWVFPVNVGDTAFLEQGCDRNFKTCVNKFKNGPNHQAEVYLPGNDRVLRWGRR